jgi:hypothetical protein
VCPGRGLEIVGDQGLVIEVPQPLAEPFEGRVIPDAGEQLLTDRADHHHGVVGDEVDQIGSQTSFLVVQIGLPTPESEGPHTRVHEDFHRASLPRSAL